MPKYRGIQKKRNRWYWYIYHDNTVTWSHGGFMTAQEAVRDRAIANEKIMKRTYVPTDKVTVTNFIKQYVKDYAIPNLRKSTVRKFEGIVRLYIIPNVGGIKLQDLKPFHIQNCSPLQKRLYPKEAAKRLLLHQR